MVSHFFRFRTEPLTWSGVLEAVCKQSWADIFVEWDPSSSDCICQILHNVIMISRFYMIFWWMRSTWNLLFYAALDISRYSNETSLMGSIRAGSSTPAGGFHVDFLLIEGTRIQRKVRFRRLLSNFPFSLVYDSNPCKVGDASNLSFYLCPCRQTIFVSAATRQPLLSPGPSRLLNKYEKETGGKKYDCNGRGAPEGAPAL